MGDPNSLSIDPAHNFAYMLADTDPSFHEWSIGSTSPLFLIRVDLSKPVPGANPNGGIDGKTTWDAGERDDTDADQVTNRASRVGIPTRDSPTSIDSNATDRRNPPVRCRFECVGPGPMGAYLARLALRDRGGW